MKYIIYTTLGAKIVDVGLFPFAALGAICRVEETAINKNLPILISGILIWKSDTIALDIGYTSVLRCHFNNSRLFRRFKIY